MVYASMYAAGGNSINSFLNPRAKEGLWGRGPISKKS